MHEPESEKTELPPFETFRPDPSDVEALITAAQNHPLGVDFLLEGELGAVSITFQTHAFTVEAARMRLRGRRS